MINNDALSQKQLDFFKAFGYVVLDQLFSPAEMETIRAEFDATMISQYPHQPFDGTRRHWATMMDEDTPLFASLLEDPRFMNVARQLYGPDVLGVIVDANRYVGDTPWHRDTATVLQYGVKFAFYLEPLDGSTGALRVMPSSHRYPNDPELAGQLIPAFVIDEVPASVLCSRPGDVVAFDLRCYHASLGGSADRRMCTVVYYGNPKNAEEEDFLRLQGGNNPKISWQAFGCTRHYLYSRRWMENGANNPDRQQWIDRLTQMGYFDWPGMVEGDS